ncbi:hypothetical protein GCM10009760_19740 [Kitasatospora kazusensis]|uniref:MarR family transcriptional regulator n=1 Tax=Kitasatospora kazusensis TaxID=407974 RepID=A0ABP5KX93_9ACTN
MDDLSLEAYGMLMLLRMHQAEGIEPEPWALAELGRVETEAEALALVEEVKASGWLDVKGCDACPSGHLCTNPEVVAEREREDAEYAAAV